MGRKVRWFDSVQKILSTSEPSPEEKEAKAAKSREKSSFKKIWSFSKSSSSGGSTSAMPAPEAHEQAPSTPPPPQHDQQQVEEITEVQVQSVETRNKQQVDEITEESSTAETAATVAAQAAPASARSTATTARARVARSREDLAAIRIQTACRSYLARRALRARGMARLTSLVEGPAVKRQTEEALYCMQTMTRIQTQTYTRRLRTEDDKKALKCQIKVKQTIDKKKMSEGWDHSHQSKEQMEAILTMKQEAASRRQKALAYAFSNQVAIGDHHSHFSRCVSGSSSELCLCSDVHTVEEQEAFFRASRASSEVHGPGQPQLGLDLDGTLDGSGDAVGEPDRAAAGQRPRRPTASRGHLGSGAHDADRQVVPAAELAVAPVLLDSPAPIAVSLREDGRAGEPEEQRAPRHQRPAAHDEHAVRAAAPEQPGSAGEQPAPCCRADEPEGRRQPAPRLQRPAAHGEHAVRAARHQEHPGSACEQPAPCCRAGEPEGRRQPAPRVQRPAAAGDEHGVLRSPPAEQPGAVGEQPAPRRREREGRRPAAADEQPAVGDPEAAEPGKRLRRHARWRRRERASDPQLHAGDQVREGQGPAPEPVGRRGGEARRPRADATDVLTVVRDEAPVPGAGGQAERLVAVAEQGEGGERQAAIAASQSQDAKGIAKANGLHGAKSGTRVICVMVT
ncbi:hypothetical protein ACP70R_034233 [Stipagrostis hirtigluma subsp. patula]